MILVSIYIDNLLEILILTLRNFINLPVLRYLGICNVLCIWGVRAIPTYRVYRLYGNLRSLIWQLSETTTTDCDAKESESDIKFQCPCGECSLETYLQDGCPKSCIPYLGMTTLSEGDRENLNYMLQNDIQKIMKSFGNLSNGICDSLIRQGVTVEKLVRVAVNFNHSLHDKLIGSTSVDQVFTHLTQEMSFFNHEILEDIINVLGDKDDKDHLDDYFKEFKEFCKRKVFEIEPGCCTCWQRLSQLERKKLFIVVLPTGENTMLLEDAVSIKKILAKVLGVPPATLHLHQIDMGSVILVFSVPDCIAAELFPLPNEKMGLLKAKGIVLFTPQHLKSKSKMSAIKDLRKTHQITETLFGDDIDGFTVIANTDSPPADHDERKEIREQLGSSAEVSLRASKQPCLMTRIGRGVKSAVGGAIGGAINMFTGE